jgi:FAD/FMN-containing dehydrogenase
VEGTPEVCERCARDLKRLINQTTARNPQFTELSENEAADFWHYIGQAIPFLLEASPAAAIFKIVQLPARLGSLFIQLGAIAERAAVPHCLMARACGVVYFAMLPDTQNADSLRRLIEAASAIFQICVREGASSTIPWSPVELKRAINIWGPDLPDANLMRGLKSAFDPQNIFAPGRLLGGI